MNAYDCPVHWQQNLDDRRLLARRFIACFLLLSVFAAACAGQSSDESASDVLIGDVAPSPEPTAITPTPPPTTGALSVPTAVPPPTALAIPEPTPEFGPTGRPTNAGEVHVLTTNAEIKRPTVYDGPDGDVIPVTYTYLNGRVDETYDWFINPTFFGNALSVMVVDGEPGDEWAKVQIPTRPIMWGWVETKNFTWSSSDYYVQVDVGTNKVKVWRGDEVIVDEVAVVTGDVGRETPLASTYVDEIMPGPSGAYGPWLLSLGVFSDAINTFGSAGGLPKVALHGTNRPDLLGQYASNGCIRLPNDVITLLANEVPVGTRVDLVRSE